jgi:hypothetical protein
MGVALMGVALMGVALMGVALMGVVLMGVVMGILLDSSVTSPGGISIPDLACLIQTSAKA